MNKMTEAEILGLPAVREAGLKVAQPPTSRGDLLLWNNLLPHGSVRAFPLPPPSDSKLRDNAPSPSID